MTGYGMLGVFDRSEALREAARGLRDRGYRRIDAYSPHPVHGLARLLGMRPTRLPWAMAVGAALGAGGVYALILYSVLVDYPINVGGRSLHAWPAFVVLAFEAGILGAAIAGFVGFIVANRLPQYYHPVFNAERFTYARGGKFYLLLHADDPSYEPGAAADALSALGAEAVEEVPL